MGSRPIALLIGSAAVLVTAILIATAFMIVSLHERALQNSERELQNVASVLARQIERELAAAEQLQARLIERFEARGALTAGTFDQALSGHDVHLLLKDRIVGHPHLGTFTLINTAGKVLNFSRSWPIPDISVTDRDFYLAHRENPKLTSFVSGPIRNRATDTWVIHVSRKLTGPHDELLGLLNAVIELEAIERFFSTVALRRHSSVFLVHRDGGLLARHPHAPQFIGQKVVEPEVLEPVFASGSGVDRRAGVDKIDRLMAGHAVGDYPLVVGASTSVAEVLAGWRREALFLAAAGSLAALLVAAFAFLIVRKLLQGNRQVQRTLERQKFQLDAALDNMLQGLCMFDASATLVLCNRRYLEMYRLSGERVRGGTHLLDILRQRCAAGTFNEDPETYAARLLADIRRGEVSTYDVETSDGRFYHVVNQPMPDGGWLSTHEDVTVKRRAERQRERDRKLLDLVIENVPSAIFLRNAIDKRYVLMNRAAERMWEAPRQALLGKTAREAFPEQYVNVIARRDEALMTSSSGLFFEEHELRTQAGNTRIVTSSLHLVQGEDETQSYVLGVIDDVTERKRADERIAYMARHNALTDLPNRTLFRERLEQALKWRRKEQRVAVLYLGLDHFKAINDSLGHQVGDKLLKAVAGRLRSCVAEGDALAHLGGDEFAVVRVGQPDDVTQLAKCISEWLRASYDLDGQHVSLTASIGIAIGPDDGSDPDQLIKNADIALARAKSEGRDTWRFFEAEMDARMRARRALELDMRKAIANDELELHYQPLVDTRDNRVVACEALLRWRHPKLGLIGPAEFVPIAEETGLIGAFGEWALRRACADAAAWPDDISVAVNLSPVQFRKPTLALTVTSALSASGLPPERLELEITESVLMQDNQTTLATLHQLRDLGVRIAMDDFGTGYSSLSYLRSFPFNKIKIDRSFIVDLSERDEAAVIVRAICDLARNLRMTTTAEGVENEMQREAVRAAGCTQMQGFLISPPRPLAELWTLLEPARLAG